MNRLRWILFSACILVLALAGWRVAAIHYSSSLPYRDSFTRNDAAEWVPMGGIWQISSGTVFNRSDEFGAKLVTGSPHWRDYELDSEMELIGHEGDVGLMVRVNEEEPGVDSYNGYYIGLRSKDSALVIGRADHGWMEGRPAAVLGGVQIGVWYRLRVAVVGCRIGAEATNLATNQQTWTAFEEHPCVPRGKIGLRSMSTGGAWRNVVVKRATLADFAAIREHASFIQTPIYPIREDSYDHMRESYFRSTFTPARSYHILDPVGTAQADASSQAIPVSIASAKSLPSHGTSTVLRGVVTLISPLYLQDNTGGIAVQLGHPVALNLGDEIELTGMLDSTDLSPHFLANEVHLLADRTLVVPVSVTSTEAADGPFDGRLVELRGRLRSKHRTGSEITLQLEDAEQNFRVVGRGGLSSKEYDRWAPGSELRIRGICTLGPWQQLDDGAFSILLRSMDDVEVLSGPPWWSPRRMARYILFLLAFIGLWAYIYVRVERWKMRAILAERVRLAHEMHDTLAQSFAGVGFHLQGLRNSVRGGSMDVPAVMEKLDVACNMVTHTHREASAEIAALHPDADEGRDLLAALEQGMQAMLDGSTPPITLVREGVPRAVSLTVRDALFQIGRESIANILRHSQATEIVLKLRYDPQHVIFEVCDNGRGFRREEHAEGFGIRGMRRRSQKVGATLQIETAEGRGTCVRVQAPYGVRLTLSNWLRSHNSSSRRAF